MGCQCKEKELIRASMAMDLDKDLYDIVHEEEENGIEEGCNPSPWAPCVYPDKNYKKTYTITRRLFKKKDNTQ